MKKVIVKNKQGIQTHGAEMEDPTQWIAHCVENNFWGKPDRWVKQGSEEYSQDDVIETQVVEDNSDAENPIVETKVKLKADYTFEIIDITYDVELQKCLEKRRNEYPSPESFLNAYFDGGQDEIEILRAIRLEIKNKYPKPIQE